MKSSPSNQSGLEDLQQRFPYHSRGEGMYYRPQMKNLRKEPDSMKASDPAKDNPTECEPSSCDLSSCKANECEPSSCDPSGCDTESCYPANCDYPSCASSCE